MSLSSTRKGVIRHVVLFKFGERTTPDEIQEAERRFVALRSKIDVIKDIEWGTDVGDGKLSEGFTHCFIVTFANKAGLDAYIPHPAHKEYASFVLARVEKVLVFDFVSG